MCVCVCVCLGKLNRGDNLSLPVIPGWDPVQYGMGHSDAVFFPGQMESVTRYINALPVLSSRA